MAKKTINLGTPNGKDGDIIRDAFNKVNDNFDELYALTGGTAAELTELAQDYAAAMFTAATHSGVTVSYDDINNKLSISTNFDGNYNNLSNKPTLFSGSYTDLTNKPTIPSDVSNLTDTSNLLFSGSYTDLTNKPTLFSGSYTDLTNKPTVPTLTSQLTNDSGYLTSIPNLLSSDVKGSIFADDSTTLIDSINGRINLDGTVSGNIIPDQDIVYDIGSPTNRFRDIYLSTSTIYLGTNSVGIDANGQLVISESYLGGEGVGDIASVQWTTASELEIRTTDTSPFVAKFDSLKKGDTFELLTGSNGSFPADTVVTLTGPATKTLDGTGDYYDFVIPVDLAAGANVFVYNFNLTKSPLTDVSQLSDSDNVLKNLASDQNITITVDPVNSSAKVWTFGTDGNLTLPGELHGSPVISGGMFPSQVGRTVNITPADDASDKKFKFRIDQYGETFTRAYFDMPEAEVDKQVAAAFPHANNTVGYIFTQGTNINDDGLNNAFNIFYNSGNIKITAMETGGAGTLRTWNFGNDGKLYLPSTGGGAGAVLRSPLNESIGISAYNDTGAGATYTLSVATTGPINIPTASTGLGRLQNPDGIEILTNSGATAKMWSFGTDGKLTVPGIIELSNGAQIFNTAGVDDSITIGATGTPGTITFNGSGFFNDDTFFHKAIQEKFSSLQDATGVVTHNCANGHIFYHTSPDANWTVNLTNFSLVTNYATAITIIISQGGTGYYPNALQIGGAAQTINWQGNATPTPSSNRVDVVTFSIFLTGGGYTVLGQLTGF